ncbi:unnamed protein product, partial [Amoebophrya sp. A25]
VLLEGSDLQRVLEGVRNKNAREECGEGPLGSSVATMGIMSCSPPRELSSSNGDRGDLSSSDQHLAMESEEPATTRLNPKKRPVGAKGRSIEEKTTSGPTVRSGSGGGLRNTDLPTKKGSSSSGAAVGGVAPAGAVSVAGGAVG